MCQSHEQDASSENPVMAKFAESPFLHTWVNKAKKRKGQLPSSRKQSSAIY